MSGPAPDAPRKYRGELRAAQNKLDGLKEIIKAGLNAGNGDGEWEALVVAGGILGLEYDEEEDNYQ